MATISSLCGICNLRNISKNSVIWCTECDEGLCVDCQEYHNLSKGSRNHTTTPISDYLQLPSKVLQISQFCSKHTEKYQTFCKKHDTPCCRKCVIESHNKCIDLAAIDDVTRNVKSSNAFLEMESNLVNLAKNIDRVSKDREGNVSALSEQRLSIEQEIMETRKMIDNYLDIIQKELLKELEATAKIEQKKIEGTIGALKEKQDEIKTLQTNIEKIKQHASDLQTFLTMKEVQSDITIKEEFLENNLRSGEICQILISCKIDRLLLSIPEELNQFGNLKVEKHPCKLTLFRYKGKEAQAIKDLIPRCIDDFTVETEKTLDTNIKKINGCSMLGDGRMVFSGRVEKEERIIVINNNGSVDFELNPGHGTYDITKVKEDNFIAVTSGNKKKISIVDIERRKVRKTYTIDNFNFGITARHNTLLYCAEGKGIQQLNIIDGAVSNLKSEQIFKHSYIANFNDNIYYTSHSGNTLTCCNLQGAKIWEFQDETVLRNPCGITIDNSGNLYVAGISSNNVVVFSNDGKHHREILSTNDGLFEPSALYYDGQCRKLLVANYNHKVFIFNIKYRPTNLVFATA